ncbi:DUF4142 domain-containing protein [Leptolyngbya ohadii]|uniref:DUF4142 domain-containing protein n=1 Tax=Leptolyngbya ohadii TaxID=1962290 RepID=UPI000B59B82E|nr:DUF4142 domain-containing protein [Leptolyngbya ohadii]
MKEFNRIAFVKRFAGVVSAAALASAVSLPVLAQNGTEQPFQNPIGPSESPSGSPSVPGNSSIDDPGRGNGTDNGIDNGINNTSPSRQQSFDSVEMDSSRVTRSGRQVRSLPFATVPGPSESPSGSPAVIGANSFADPARSLDRSVTDRVEEAGKRQETQRISQTPSGFETVPGPSETPSGSPAVEGANRSSDPGLYVQPDSGSMQMNQGTMNMPMNQQGINRTSSGTTQSAAPTALDQEFIRMAAQSNNAEIATSQLALQKSSNEEVREYAERMIQEHTLANQRLQPIAARYGVQLPTGVDPLSAAISQRLSQLSGQEFDRGYMQAQASAHMRTVALFQTQIAQGQAPEAKAYASALLPNVQDHYQMANAMSNTFSAQRLVR